MIEHRDLTHYKKMRWKNGAGYTFELARSAGDDLDAFDWRISMADVKTSGDFSKFSGLQRILTVLEGQGLVLHIDVEVRQLNTLQSVQFSGSSAVSCELIAGTVRDFNLIYDPQKLLARYQWITQTSTTEIFSSADLVFIFNQSLEALEIIIDQQIFHLKHQESLLIDQEKRLKSIVLTEQQLKQTCLIELTKI